MLRRSATFVNISTDKAAEPDQRARAIEADRRATGGRRPLNVAAGTYLSVRFGNVLGSRGSVLTTFTEQIAAGGPITVTHPDVTRFFMTIPEAVQLVVQAAAIGRAGEVLVLDMGEPVRIVDVARQLMEHGRAARSTSSTPDCGPARSCTRSCSAPASATAARSTPPISHVPVPPLTVDRAKGHATSVGARQAMIDLPGFPSVAPEPRARHRR